MITINCYFHFLESEEGRYRFEFADNVSIDQFLYSRVIFNKRELNTYRNILKNDTDLSSLQDLGTQNHFVAADSNFQDCIDYYKSSITIKHIGIHPMEKYIKCFILNGDSKRCDWKWSEQERKFMIFANRSSFNQTRFKEFENFGIRNGDIFGVLRCHMKIQYVHGNVKFDLPFVSRLALTTGLISKESKEKIGMIVLLSSCFLIFLLFLAINWMICRRRNQLKEQAEMSK